MLNILGISLPAWLWLTILGALCFFLGWLFNYFLLNRGAKDDCFEEERNRLRAVESELKTAVASRDKIQTDFNASSGVHARLEGDLKGKLAELAAATAAGVALKATIDKLTGEKDVHAKELADWKLRFGKLEGDLKAANDAKLKLEGDLKAKTAGESDWNLKLTARDKELADWKARFAKLELDVKGNDEKHSALNVDLKSKAAELAAAVAGGALLQTTISKLTGEKDGAAKELADWKARYAKLELDLKGAQAGTVELADLRARIGKLEGELKAANERYAKLDAEHKTHMESHKGKASELAAAVAGGALLQTTISKITGEKDAAGKELADLKARYAKLELDLKGAQAGTVELADLRARIAKLEADLKTAGESRAKVEADLKAATDARVKAEGDAKSKLTELAAAAASGAALTATINKLTGDKDNSGKELADLKARYAKLEAELKATGDNTVKFESSVKARDAELADWKARYAKLEADAKAAAEARAKAEGDAKAKAAELVAAAAGGATLQATISKLTGERDGSAKELADWKARYAKLEADLKAAGDNTVKFESSVKARDTELADVKGRYAKLEAELKAANDARAKAEGDAKGKAAELAAAVAGGATLQAAISKLTGERDGSSKELADWKARVAKLEADVAAANDARARAEGDAKSKVSELAAAVAGGALLQTNISKLTSERDGNAKEVAELKARVGSLQAEVNNLMGDKNALAAAAGSRDGELNTLKAQMGELRAQYNALNSTAQDREAQLAYSNAELGRLRSDFELAARERDEAAARAAAATAAAAAAAAAAPVTANKFAMTGTAEMKQAGKAAKAAARAALGSDQEVVSACPQHLSDVKGIGTVFEGRLYGSDIGTFWELGHLSDDDFKKILEVTDMDMIRVPFEDTRKDALRIARETKTVGRTWTAQAPDDFEPYEGIGYTYEKRLYDAGICTHKALAACSVAELEKICITGRKPPKMPDFASWIAQAKKLAK